MSLVSVSWTSFKLPGFMTKFELDSVLQKGERLCRVSEYPQKTKVLKITSCWITVLLFYYKMKVK